MRVLSNIASDDQSRVIVHAMTTYDIVTNEMATTHQQPSNHTKHHSFGLNAELLKVSESNGCEGIETKDSPPDCDLNEVSPSVR